MTDHEYMPRSDGFRTQGVIGGKLVEGVPCIICANFEQSHTPVPEPVPAAAVVEPPVVKAARKLAPKKAPAKKTTQKKTTAKRTKK